MNQTFAIGPAPAAETPQEDDPWAEVGKLLDWWTVAEDGTRTPFDEPWVLLGALKSRLAETPQAWQFTREEYEQAVREWESGKPFGVPVLAMLREAAQHAPSSQVAETPREDQGTDTDELLIRIAQELKDLKRQLRTIQWNGDPTFHQCPACGAWEQSGHEAHCWIGKVLA